MFKDIRNLALTYQLLQCTVLKEQQEFVMSPWYRYSPTKNLNVKFNCVLPHWTFSIAPIGVSDKYTKSHKSNSC